MPFNVYILRCSDATYYTGHTDNIDARMAHHSDGTGSAYTSKRRPLELIWATDCQTREQRSTLKSRSRAGRAPKRKR